MLRSGLIRALEKIGTKQTIVDAVLAFLVVLIVLSTLVWIYM